MKKAGWLKIDAFELWCWRRLLRVPWTARRSNQSILKEISPRCSLEGLMLKLKLQNFGHLMRRVDSLEKSLMLGGIGGRRRRGRGRMRWLDGITNSMGWVWVNSGSLWWTGRPGCCNSWGLKESDATELLNWIETMVEIKKIMVTSLKRSHAYSAIFHASNLQQETTDPQLLWDSQTPTGKSPVGSLFFSPGFWCTRFCCALQESISQSYVSSGSSMVSAK